MKPKFVAVFLLALSSSAMVVAEETEEIGRSYNYIPEVHGTLRGKYEVEPDGWKSRFQVRNARVKINGMVAPIVDYVVQVDFCDRGKVKVLDAWGRVAIGNYFKVQVGQMRLPFSIDASRSPANYVFANRSFIAKQVGNVRNVGIKGVFKAPGMPLYVEAGVYNSASMSDHQVWEKGKSLAAKANYKIQNVTVEAGFESVKPDSVRMNLVDGSVHWESGRWMVEGEYIYKHYADHAYKGCHAYNVMADYHIPLTKCFFNRLSFQGRWDGMTDHSDGTRNEDKALWTTEHARDRLTVGATLTYVYSKVKATIKLNYENYFYRNGFHAPEGDRDKILAELTIQF